MTQLNTTEVAGRESQPDDWQNRTLADLMAYIVAKHHAYLRIELPAIETLVGCPSSGPNGAVTLAKVVRQFRTEMEQHLKKEEAILFPMIEKLEAAVSSDIGRPRFPFGSIGNPIAVMEEEHERARKQLAEIRAITNDYTTVPEGCSKQPSTLARLRGLDNDMEIHSRLEDEILFSRAIRLERCKGGASEQGKTERSSRRWNTRIPSDWCGFARLYLSPLDGLRTSGFA